MSVQIKPLGESDYSLLLSDGQSLSLREHLGFSDDIDYDVDAHPAWQAFWEITASLASKEAEEFRLILCQKYFAHCRRFAKLALKGLKDKETLQSVDDMVSTIFSEETTELARERYAQAAFKGELLASLSDSKVEKAIRAGDYAKEYADFKLEMYSYSLGRATPEVGPLTYERVIRHKLNLKAQAEALKAVAFGAVSRGQMLTNRTKLEMPKVGNQASIDGSASEFNQIQQQLNVGNRR